MRFVGKNAKTQIIIHEDGRCFYLRFYDEELRKELDEIAKNFARLVPTLKITEENGTYCVKDSSPAHDIGQWSAFDLLSHKYMALANDIHVDEANGERYYPVRMSDSYIEPCDRRLA